MTGTIDFIAEEGKYLVVHTETAQEEMFTDIDDAANWLDECDFTWRNAE